MEFIVSQNLTSAALSGGETLTADLGVNGLSHLVCSIFGDSNIAGTPANPVNVLDVISNFQVTYNGQAIISGPASIVARVGAIICGRAPEFICNATGTTTNVGVTFLVPFGRTLFGTQEGFPAVPRGTLQVLTQVAGSFTNITNPVVSIGQVEIPGNRFTKFLKYTQRALTAAATGQQDIPLPIGNLIRGIHLKPDDPFITPTIPGSIDSAILLVDNVEKYWTGGSISMPQLLAGMYPRYDWTNFIQTFIVAGQTPATTADEQFPLAQDSYYLDLDPTKDDAFSLDTRGHNLITLRPNFAATDTLVVHAVEAVPANLRS